MKRIRLFAVLALALLAIGLGSCSRRIDADLSQKVAGSVGDINAVYDDVSKHLLNHDPKDPYAAAISPMAGSHTSRALNFRMNLEDSGEDFAGGLSYSSFYSDSISWNIGIHSDGEDYLSGGAHFPSFSQLHFPLFRISSIIVFHLSNDTSANNLMRRMQAGGMLKNRGGVSGRFQFIQF